MKVNEMTNEEIADNLEVIPVFIVKEARKYTAAESILREAAARLRNVTVRTDNSGVIAELSRRLKIAEDALAGALSAIDEFMTRTIYRVHGAEIGEWKAALAAIREEGAKE